MSGIYCGDRYQLVQLSALAKVAEALGPSRSITSTGCRRLRCPRPDPPFAQGEALDSIDRMARRVLPPGSTTRWRVTRRVQGERRCVYFAFAVRLLSCSWCSRRIRVHDPPLDRAAGRAARGDRRARDAAHRALLHRPGGTINLLTRVGMVC